MSRILLNWDIIYVKWLTKIMNIIKKSTIISKVVGLDLKIILLTFKKLAIMLVLYHYCSYSIFQKYLDDVTKYFRGSTYIILEDRYEKEGEYLISIDHTFNGKKILTFVTTKEPIQ